MKSYEIDALSRKLTVDIHARHKYWFEHGLHIEVTPHFVDIYYKDWMLGSVWKEDKYQKQLVITAVCSLLEALKYDNGGD